MSTGIKLRDDFYNSIQRDLHLSIPETKQVLESHKFSAFDPSLVKEYRKVLETYKKSKDQVEESRKAWQKQLDPCPIPGCTGRKIRTVQPWPWKCSTGGYTHYLAIRCAEQLVSKDASFESVTAKAKEVIDNWEKDYGSLSEEKESGL